MRQATVRPGQAGGGPYRQNGPMRNAANTLIKTGLVVVLGWTLAAGMLFLLPGIARLLPPG